MLAQFPIIETLDDIVPHIESNKQIRVKVDEFSGQIGRAHV